MHHQLPSSSAMCLGVMRGCVWASPLSGPGELGVVELLLEEGADPDLEDEAGQTPMHWAACVGHAAVIDKLVAGHGSSAAAANKRDAQGWTPLHHAANHGAKAAVVALLQVCMFDSALVTSVRPGCACLKANSWASGSEARCLSLWPQGHSLVPILIGTLPD